MRYKIFLSKDGNEIELTDRNIRGYDQPIINAYEALKNQPVPYGSKIEAYVPGGHVMVKRLVY